MIDYNTIKHFISTNHEIFRFFIIIAEIILILYINYKWNHYSKRKTVSIIEFICALFFADTINPLPGFTDFVWVPIYSLYFGVTSFMDITWQQLVFYEATTAIIGVIGFLATYWYFGRVLKIK